MSLRSTRSTNLSLSHFLLSSFLWFTDNLTIADLPLIAATVPMEAIDFKLDAWPRVAKWYDNFKQKHPDLWEVAQEVMQQIIYFEKNPPEVSMDHPIHPVRKNA